MIGNMLRSAVTDWLSSMFGGFEARMFLVVVVGGALMLFASAAKKFVGANKGLIFGLLLIGVLVCWIAAPSIGRGSAGVRQSLTRSAHAAKQAAGAKVSGRGHGQAGGDQGGPVMPVMPMYGGTAPMPPVGYAVGSPHPHTGSPGTAGGAAGGSAAHHHAAATVAHTSHNGAAPAHVQHAVSAAPSRVVPGAANKPAGPTAAPQLASAAAKPTGAPATPAANPSNASTAANKAQTPASPASAASPANKPAPANPATTPQPASSTAAASEPSVPQQRWGRSQRQLERLWARRGVSPPPKAQSAANGANMPAKAGSPGPKTAGAGKGSGKAAADSHASRAGATTHPSTETPTTRQYGLSAGQRARMEAQRTQARMAEAQFSQEFHQQMQTHVWGGNHGVHAPQHGVHGGAGPHGQVHHGGQHGGHQ